MKRASFGRAAFVFLVCTLTIVTGAFAQRVSDSDAVRARASFAHLTVGPRAIGFGVAKSIKSKSIRIRNTGDIDAQVNVVAPTTPFSITAGGGSFSLAPRAEQTVTVQFAPMAAGRVTQDMAIQCSNCNTIADQNVTLRLAGNARGPVTATPTGTLPVPTPTPGAASNALPFSVTAVPFEEADEGLASITVCATGTSNCTVVEGMLVDTGSTGIRIFGSQLSGLGINPNMSEGSEIGECAFFGSGSTWGAVSTVDLKIAGEPTITIPIQVMDDSHAFAPAPHDCTNGSPLMSSPNEAGFNGLLGLGQVANDQPNIFSEYFDCSGQTCTAIDNPPSNSIVLNPVSSLPVDNNGVVVSLPAISPQGEESTNGTILFGIGTESNNHPGSVTVLMQDNDLNSFNYLGINTMFGGKTAGSFFDTGSNGLFFNSTITQCSDGSGFYCPAFSTSESATNQSVGSAASSVVSFSVANADSLFNTNNAAYNNLGGTFDGGTSFDGFDWGLPFFFGRDVFLGEDGTLSSLGTGPYTAY